MRSGAIFGLVCALVVLFGCFWFLIYSVQSISVRNNKPPEALQFTLNQHSYLRITMRGNYYVVHDPECPVESSKKIPNQ